MTVEDLDRAEQARAIWRLSAATGRPLTGAELGRRFGMSERWGRDRAAEAREVTIDAGPGFYGYRTALLDAAREVETWRGRPSAARISRELGVPMQAANELANALLDEAQTPTPANEEPAMDESASTAPTFVDYSGKTAIDPAPLLPLANGNGHQAVPAQRPAPAATSALPDVSTSREPAQTATGTRAPLPITPPTTRQKLALFLLASPFLVPGLGISAWSLYGYMRSGGAPALLSLGASAAVDGIGMFAAVFAAWFTDHGLPTRYARVVTYLMVIASVYINYAHASTQHWPEGLHVLIALPAAAAAAAFELVLLRLRVVERARHEQRRRSRQAAKIDPDLWLRRPLMAWRARQWEAADRIRELFPEMYTH
jgi:Protein of unknown function (DUF2637)